ncbi:hypothetical protein [Spartinivicinus poritis]|uniref:Uncharacterized protein n=1 Tax=Spartinivicinus poritis TaxID=2994640 RepID=A0ABT5U9N2_9GAMM|nr:hypothetical protein [Spartinivicinus sp. A2-2]MDE1462178.1 hypothetical protein [Spartinivicinus sp. A2-2]
MEDKDNPDTAYVVDYDLFGWYWQPKALLQQRNLKMVTDNTHTVIEISQQKVQTEAMCEKVKRQFESYYNEIKKIKGKIDRLD